MALDHKWLLISNYTVKENTNRSVENTKISQDKTDCIFGHTAIIVQILQLKNYTYTSSPLLDISQQ